MGLILSPILAVLRAIPWWAYAIAACLAWGGFQRHRAVSAAKEYQQAQAEAAAEREQALQAAINETARRLAAQAQATKEADEQTARAVATAAGAIGAANRLRSQLAAIKASAAASHPTAAGAGQTGRLADVLAECVDRYRTVAAAADRAIIAGRTCERVHNSLTSPWSGAGPN